jgi:hypothetical protein
MDIFKSFLEMDKNIDSVKCEECLLDLSPVERQDSAVRCKVFFYFCFVFVIYLYFMNIDRLIDLLMYSIVFFRKVILYV